MQRNLRACRAPFLVIHLTLVGCASDAAKDSRPAASLVYSPLAGRADRDDRRETASATEDPQPPSGRTCRLHLRRDVMGIAAPLTGNNVSADRVAVSGVVNFVSREWVVFRTDNSTYWIPRDAVLAVEYTTR